MGDNSYAYVNPYDADGMVSLNTEKNMLKYIKVKGFIWTPCYNLTYYRTDGARNYIDIVVKFKVGKNIIDLETYFKEQYPEYQQYSLKVIKQSGLFCMDEGSAVDKLNEIMVELFKKSSLATFDCAILGGQKERKYVSATGFSSAYSKCQ